MEIQIVECPKCAIKNRIGKHSDGMKAICGHCGTALLQDSNEQPIDSPLKKTKSSIFLVCLLVALLVAVIYGIMVTPNLMRKDFSLLRTTEAQQTEILKKQHRDELAARKALLEKERAAINAQDLQRKATQNYRRIFEARKSFDKRFALSPREKTQLRMHGLSSDSTKSFHDTIRSVAREASPDGADIRVRESSKGIALYIDFDMSSMTSGEYGTRTKHHTKKSLRKEVVSLISRVTNDILQFCGDLNIRFIYVGCRHYVKPEYSNGETKNKNIVLYKIKIQKSKVPQLSSNPYLDIYSTTKLFEVDEDNFDEIRIVKSRS